MRSILLFALFAVACDPASGTLSLLVDGEPLDGPIALGAVRAHHEAPLRVVTLRNDGEGPLAVSAVSVPDGAVLGGDAPPLTLAPGASAALTLTLAAHTDQVLDADLVLVSDDRSAPERAVPLTGRVDPWVQRALEPHPDVEAALDAEIARQGLVGLGVGVARGDTVVFLRGFGWADQEAEVPVDPDATLFRWASLSKGLTGVVAVQADAVGALSLDDDVAVLLDDYEVPATYLDGCDSSGCETPIPQEGRRVTLRDLLRHVGGAQHYDNGLALPVPPPVLTDTPETNTGIRWALDYWVDAPLVAVPGTRYAYSTFGYNLAGAAIEAALGRPFDEIVIDGVAVPLSMHSLAADRKWVDLPNRAVGYIQSGGRVRADGDTDVSWKAPGGGFLSTPADLTAFCAGLQGEVLMPRATRDAVLWAASEPAPRYALGFGVNASGTLVSHTGSQQKVKTAIAWLPEQDLCFTVMTNSTWADPWAVLTVLRQAWLAPADG